MRPEIIRDAVVDPVEIESLRVAVGWDRSEGTYEQVLRGHFAPYSACGADGLLVGYLSVLSDGTADALFLDLMVHPDHQRTGIGTRLVTEAVADMRDDSVGLWIWSREEPTAGLELPLIGTLSAAKTIIVAFYL